MTTPDQAFPEQLEPVAEPFRFACHQGLDCFTRCCRKLELRLYPYDVLRLKNRLAVHSEEFLNRYGGVIQGDNPFFPTVIMRMRNDAERTCPFLDESSGCQVYTDRPSACRTYPLERAVAKKPGRHRLEERYFLTSHPYCLGHQEARQWTVKEWLRDQQLVSYNAMDDLWAEMSALFASNPWQGEGVGGPRQQLAFMVCYNLDRFRQYLEEQNLLARFRLDKSRKRAIAGDDEALLAFGFDWLKYVLAGLPVLQPKGGLSNG